MRRNRSNFRGFKCFLVMFVVTFIGTFITFKVLQASTDNPYLKDAGYREWITGHKVKYKKGSNLRDKALADTKAARVNEALDEILPWMLIAFVISFSFGLYPCFKIWSYAWWV